MLDNTPTAVLLPGQGGQVPGMRDAVAGARSDLLEVVLALVGDGPFDPGPGAVLAGLAPRRIPGAQRVERQPGAALQRVA